MGRIGSGWSKTSMSQKQERARIGKFLAGIVTLLAIAVVYWLVPSPAPDNGPAKTINDDLGPSLLRQGIYDRNLQPLAVSIESFSVYVKPREFTDISETSRQLAGVFGYGEEGLVNRLKTERGFYWLAHSISPAKAADLAALNLEGVYLAQRSHRYYPGSGSAPGIIGEVREGQGLSGMEFQYNDVLSDDGKSLVLTLDQDIQNLLTDRLTYLLSQVGAPSPDDSGTRVSATVIAPKSGDVLASAMLSVNGGGDNEPLFGQGDNPGLFGGRIKAGALLPLFLEAALLNSGREISAQGWGDAGKILVPAARKKKRGQLYDNQWQQTAEGEYVSSWLLQLAAGINEVEGGADAMLSVVDKAAFAYALGLSGPQGAGLVAGGQNVFDQQADNRFLVDKEAKTSSLYLLTAAARLFNGGRVIEPNLVMGLVGQDGDWERTSAGSDRQNIFSRQESNRFAGLILNYLPEDEYVMVAEMVSPRRLHELTAVTHGRDEVVLGPGRTRGEQVGSFDSVLLAVGPLADSKMAILVRVENGIMPSRQISPMNEMARGFFDRALPLLVKKKARAGGAIKSLDQEELFGRWLAARGKAKAERDPGAGLVAPVMPDLKGMSLRKALRQLQPLGVKVSINGSGMVTGQQPAAGVKIKDRGCVLIARRMAASNYRTKDRDQ